MVARAAGDFDLSAVEIYGQFLERAESDGVGDVIVDLSDVTFLDSTGLRMLLTTDRLVRERDQRFWIVRGGPSVQKVLRVTGMDGVLPVVDGIPDL